MHLLLLLLPTLLVAFKYVFSHSDEVAPAPTADCCV